MGKEEAEDSAVQARRFKPGDFVRRRGEWQVGQVRAVLDRFTKKYSVVYKEGDTTFARIMSEDSLLAADQPTRFGFKDG